MAITKVKTAEGWVISTDAEDIGVATGSYGPGANGGVDITHESDSARSWIIPTLSVDSKGRITNIKNNTIYLDQYKPTIYMSHYRIGEEGVEYSSFKTNVNIENLRKSKVYLNGILLIEGFHYNSTHSVEKKELIIDFIDCTVKGSDLITIEYYDSDAMNFISSYHVN